MPTLRRRPDGRYFIDYVAPDGSRPRPPIRRPLDNTGHRWEPVRDPELAQAIFDRWLETEWPRILAQENIPPQRTDTTTIKGLCDWYLDAYCVGRVRESTLRLYGSHLAHFKAFCEQNGVRMASAITSALIEAYRANLAGSMASTTLATNLVVVRTMYRVAAELDLMPAVPVKWPSVKQQRRQPVTLTPEQIRTLLDTVESKIPWAYPALCWQALTGCRSSDVVGLRWEHVREDAVQFSQQKTGGVVTIPLTPRLKVLLAEQRLRSRRSPYVFPSRRGDKQNHMSLWYAVRTAAQQAGLPAGVSPKTFRHSLATWLLRERVPVKVVSARLGHANPQTTIQQYQHVMIEDNAVAGQMAEDAIFGAMAPSVAPARHQKG